MTDCAAGIHAHTGVRWLEITPPADGEDAPNDAVVITLGVDIGGIGSLGNTWAGDYPSGGYIDYNSPVTPEPEILALETDAEFDSFIRDRVRAGRHRKRQRIRDQASTQPTVQPNGLLAS